MKVAGLDTNNDWRFGKGLASYKTEADAIRQNVVTRLKFFQFDWFLDNKYGIDWFTLLSNRNTESIIQREVQRIVLSTDGVAKINSLSIVTNNKRFATISLSFSTFFDKSYQDEIGITL